MTCYFYAKFAALQRVVTATAGGEKAVSTPGIIIIIAKYTEILSIPL